MLKIELPKIPQSAWQCEIGKQWDKPYTVCYPGNLDDGANHGMPLGGMGGCCISFGGRKNISCHFTEICRNRLAMVIDFPNHDRKC